MDKDQIELYYTNDDIIFLLSNSKKVGWETIKVQSIYRIIYLSKVLYSFANGEEPNIFEYYHFTTTLSGPYSRVISNSLDFLYSNQFISNSDTGIELSIDDQILHQALEVNNDDKKEKKQNWFKTVILLLSKYGENRIFSFTINDPLYQENLDSNSIKEITFDNSENRTLEVLNSFKGAFEESIQDTSSISREEYLELYFEYIFSQIIK